MPGDMGLVHVGDVLHRTQPVRASAGMPVNIVSVHFADMPCCVANKFHRHDFFELAWLSRGSAVYSVDFHEYPCEAGTMAFVTPGQIHTWFYEPDDCQLLIIGFKPELFAMHGMDMSAMLASLPFYTTDDAPLLRVPEAKRAIVQYQFETALQHNISNDPQRESLLLAYLNVVLAEAQTLYAAERPQRDANAALRLTRAFQLALEKHYADRILVQDYADMLGVTANHLVETVRQTSGTTPGQLLHRRLLLEAKRLLIHTDWSVTEIAGELSFSSPSQFGRWFKNLEGVSPGEFRQ